MNALSPLLAVEDVLLDVQVTDKTALLRTVGARLAQRHAIDAADVIDALLAREQLGSTAIGHGVAVPHARIRRLAAAVAAYARPHAPIPFDAPDGKPVGHVVVLLVPALAADQHLRLLATIAEHLSDAGCRRGLADCATAAAARALLVAEREPGENEG
ncbi:MAG TPA: PTS sugar transporter subunit IIA [Burkholderiaceae bacterium]|nr:PTS sugar transporter subunit IIA [Burkholderiaceae bacterium]